MSVNRIWTRFIAALHTIWLICRYGIVEAERVVDKELQHENERLESLRNRCKHKWINASRRTKRLVFYERGCSYCGKVQLKNEGPTGDGSWVDVEDAFKGPVGDWERGEYEKAI